MNDPAKENAQQDTALPFSPRSIEFWRHIVGMVILLAALPPYGSFNPYELPESLAVFLGTASAKAMFAIFSAGVLTLLGVLFLTDKVKGRYWDVFVMTAWFCGFVGVYLMWYGQAAKYY